MRENDDRSAPLGCSSSSSSSFASPSASCHNRGGVGIAPRGREYISGYKEKQSVSSPFHNNAILMPHSPAGGSETRVSRLGLSRGSLFPRHFSLAPSLLFPYPSARGKRKIQMGCSSSTPFLLRQTKTEEEEEAPLGEGRGRGKGRGSRFVLLSTRLSLRRGLWRNSRICVPFQLFPPFPLAEICELRGNATLNINVFFCISVTFPEKEILLSHFKLSCKRPKNSKHWTLQENKKLREGKKKGRKEGQMKSEIGFSAAPALLLPLLLSQFFPLSLFFAVRVGEKYVVTKEPEKRVGVQKNYYRTRKGRRLGSLRNGPLASSIQRREGGRNHWFI